MNEKRKEYEEKFDAQLEEWKKQFAQLKVNADKATSEAKIEYHKTLEILQHKQDEAAKKLHELKAVGDEAWEDLKTGADNAWTEIKAAFNDAARRFK